MTSLLDYRQEALNTDLYQLTMAAGYHSQNLEQTASFELYVRRFPPHRSFLLAAGLEQALEYLEHLHFEAEDIAWLRAHPAFQRVSPSFFEMLQNVRFQGDVWALPEGSLFFPYEPVVRVTAPLIQAQLVETWLLSQLNYQISVASKAARISLALEGKRPAQFIDFGSRRTHGPHASLLAARAAFIGGASGTSNIAAGRALEIPVLGTAAHSWTMAFASEQEAFAAYHEVFPHNSILLVDTYDTLQGIRHAIATGRDIKGIRLDSGDFLSLSRTARHMLDEAGLHQAIIVVSGDMNEYKIRDLRAAEAPIDVFGIGTELVTSLDAPSLGGVYKLAETHLASGHTRYALKLSSQKTSYPGCKQIWRELNPEGTLQADYLGLAHEKHSGQALLEPVMRAGQRLKAPESLELIRRRSLKSLQTLPQEWRQPESTGFDPVEKSPEVLNLFNSVREEMEKKEILS